MGLKPKNRGHAKFYECCDLTKKVYLVYGVFREVLAHVDPQLLSLILASVDFLEVPNHIIQDEQITDELIGEQWKTHQILLIG